ncbi:unnamed protein product [Ilex paraguariensis]|uniref:Uncharacterized protein n=1 Tax=Ilex paraguariensis TaxID=185542 RepID=A0ABC8UJC9_9AQUA
MSQLSICIAEKLATLPSTPYKPYLFKINDALRRENSEAYEPEIVAIGPYHRGKVKLQMMEEHKLLYLQELLKRRNELNVDMYVIAMQELEQKARKCYAEPIKMNRDEFVEMLLLDGTFIIELFRKFSCEEQEHIDDPIFQATVIWLNIPCLINFPKDAEKLHHYGIIDNWLGDDKVVSTLFNKLGNQISINSATFCYLKVFNKVNKHCERRRHTWMAKVKHNYFNSPWSTISVVGAGKRIAQTIIGDLPQLSESQVSVSGLESERSSSVSNSLDNEGEEGGVVPRLVLVMQVKSSELQRANDDDVGAVEVMQLKSSELQGANDDDVGAVELHFNLHLLTKNLYKSAGVRQAFQLNQLFASKHKEAANP